MDHERVSRRINSILFNDPTTMFCARARPPVSWAIDLWWWLRWGEVDHCRKIANRERWRRLELIDRLRWLDGG